MTVYNGEKYLKETIDSILSQSYQDFEILIIDDNSIDRTHEIIRSYNDSRIKLFINNERIGLPESLNKGIRLAKGIYLARIDSDDVCIRNRLEMQVHYLDRHPECGLVAGKVKLINYNGVQCGYWCADINAISREKILEKLPFENCIAQSSVMGRTEIFLQYLYDEDILYAEDYELWMRLAGNNVIIDKINEFIVYYRVHQENLSFTFEKSKNLQDNFNDIRKRVLRRMNFFKNPLFYSRVLYAIIVIEKGTYVMIIKRYLKQLINRKFKPY